MRILKRPVASGSKPNRSALDYQSLEPRQLLAGLLNSSVATGVAGPTSLYYEVNEPTPVDLRMDVLRTHLQLDQHDQLRLVNLERDQLGFSHFKYQQYYNGIQVEGGIYKVHSRDGQVTGLSGDYQRVGKISTNAKLTESEAFVAALDFVGAEVYAWESENGQLAIPSQTGEASMAHASDFEIPTGQLAILDNSDGEKRLTFKFDIYAIQPLSRAYVFVDAVNGDIVRIYDRINTIDTPATGTSLYNGSVNFTADDTGSLFRLRQSRQGVETYSLNGFTSYSNATDITSISTTFTAPSVHRGVSAHYGVEQAMSFYQQTFGRNSFDGNGSIVQSFVSYGNGVNNAFWNGSVLTFGDGDGFFLDPLVSIDVVAHEFTHAVTQNSADLDYFLEPGALNESFSDIFGEVVEHFATGSTDWLAGEDFVIGEGNALRSLSDPKAFGNPDTYFGENWFVGGADNGGVHTNSGVQNKWFYLVAEGGAGINDGNVSYDIEGLGIQDATAIAYRNLTLYLTPGSQYADARIGAIQSAVDLFGPGSPQHVTTEAAWDAVGVYDPNVELIPVAAESGTPGSMIYNINRIDSFDLGFTDTYVIPLDAAQNLTVVLEGQGTLVPMIEIYDPTGALIAETTGSGNMAVVQSVPVIDGGFFFVVVGGANNTFGEYTMDVYFNADVELEARGGLNNNDINSAQSLETSSLGFFTPSQSDYFDHLAVSGSLENELPTVTPFFSDSFESGTFGPEWTSSSTGNGRIALTTAYGSADGSYALLMDTSSGYALNEAILSLDLSAISHPLLRFSQAEWGDETHSLPVQFSGSFNGDGIAISNDGTNWYTVLTDMSSNSGEWNDVSIDLFEAALLAGITLDANFQVKFQQYDNFSLPDDGRAFDAIEIVESEAPADWYSFDVADGQFATAFATNEDRNNYVQLDIFNEIGTLIYTGASSGELDSLVDPIVGDGGTYFARVTGDREYNLVVTRGAAFNIEPNDLTAQDITDVSAVFGNVISLGIAGAEPDNAPFGTVLDRWFIAVTLSNNVTGGSVYSYDGSYFGAPTGNAVFARDPEALGYFWRQGADELRADFSIPQQTVSIDVGSDDPSDFAWLRAFDENGFLIGEEYSGSVARGESETLTISRPNADIAYIVSAGIDGEVVPLDNLVFDINVFDEDLYSVNVSAGEFLSFTASIPGAGPNLFRNRLYESNQSHLFIELIDPSGNSIVVDNWNIEHTATVSGTYQVRVFADESAGEYILIRDIQTGINEPAGIDFGPVNSDVYQNYAAVSDEAYDPGLGYGWLSSNGLIAFTEQRGNALIRDKVSLRNGTFVIDVDNGNYQVDIVLGVIKKTDAIEITVEGQTDTFTPQPGPNVTRTFIVNVADRQLTIDLDGLAGLNNRMTVSGIVLNEIQGRTFNEVETQFAQIAGNYLAITPIAGSLEKPAYPIDQRDVLTTTDSPELTFESIRLAVGLRTNTELEGDTVHRDWRYDTNAAQGEPLVLFDFKDLLEFSDEFLFEL